MALREHFFALFLVGVALGLFSAARFYMVSWIGERVTADLRNAVYAHVLRQSPEFFETTQTGEVLSRLTTDTTLVQTVVGSSLSMGLRNSVMGIGALAMLIVTNPYVMTQVLGILVLVVLPSLLFGRRVRAPEPRQPGSRGRLERHRRRGAERDAGGAELRAGAREAARFARSTEEAFQTARKRTRVRAALVAFIISATFGTLLWGLYQGTQAVLAGQISAGHLGQTVVYVIILVSSVAVLSEVYGDLLRAAGATERLMELLAARSPVPEPAQPRALPAVIGGSSVAFEQVTLPLPVAAAARRAARRVACTCGPARRWRWSARAAPARARCSSCCCASTTCSSGRVAPRRRAGARADAGRPAPARRHRAAGQHGVLDQRDGEHPLRPARGRATTR